jgi:uncharacterized protein (TIGR00725 family)
MNKTISIIGPNSAICSKELYDFCELLGEKLVDIGFTIISGGMLGIMEAVFKGAHKSSNYTFGKTIGIIPSYNRTEANKYCDIIIPTGIGIARNVIVANSSDNIIAIGGGAGTLSEIALAWQLNKTIYTFDNFEGWAKSLSGQKLDNRSENKILIRVSCISELVEKLLK